MLPRSPEISCYFVKRSRLDPKSQIHKRKALEEKQDDRREETFFGFVDYDNVDDLGIDMRNININQSCIFAFLTKEVVPQHIKDESDSRVFLNVLVLDVLGFEIQAALF